MLNSLNYLPVVMDELKRSILPALPPAARANAEDLMRVLGCVYLEEMQGPILLEDARAPYAEAIALFVAELPLQSSNCAAMKKWHANLAAGEPIDVQRLQQSLSAAIVELGAMNTASAWRALGKLAEVDKDYASAAEERYRAITTRSPAVDDAMLPIEENLPTYLRSCFPDDKHVEVESVRYVKGGFANYTAVVGLRNTVSLPRQIVVRADRKGFHPTGVSVAYEYPILTHAHESGVCVPRPYALEKTGSVLGTPFVLVAYASGTNIGDFVEVRHPRAPDLARDLARKIAQLHLIPLESLSDKVRGHDQSTRETIRKTLDTMHAAWHSSAIAESGVATPGVESVFQWLYQHLDDCEGHRCLIHQDLGFHNMLVEGDRITAILDWSDASAGNPAQDLAYVKMSVDQIADWDDFLKAYAEAGAPLPTQEQIDFYSLIGRMRTTVWFTPVEVNAKAGLVKDIPFVYLIAHYLRRCKVRLFDEFSEVLQRRV